MQTYRFTEYDNQVVDCPAPTAADKRLAQSLAAGGDVDARIEVDWLDGGRMRVRTYSWVGVVRFAHLEIRVIPKLVGGTLRILRMIEYAGGVPLLTRLPTDRRLPGDGDDLFDLIVLLLVEETRAIIRDGLMRDYHAVDDSLAVLRGRLRVRDQLLLRYGQFDRIECSFDEFDGDVPENQLLAAALHAAAPRAADEIVRNNARMIAAIMNEVCEPRSRQADWYSRNIHYGRRNASYASAHTLAKLILEGAALNDHNATTEVNITSFMVDMNSIFERFVTQLVINVLSGTPLRVRAQKSIRAVILDETTGGTYSTIRPDLIIEDTRTGDAVPIDVKYKLYDAAKKVSTSDIYQAFIYAYSLSHFPDSPRAGLIYPSTAPNSGPSLYIKPLAGAKPARVCGAGIDVPSILDALGSGAESPMYDQMRMTLQEVTGLPRFSPC